MRCKLNAKSVCGLGEEKCVSYYLSRLVEEDQRVEVVRGSL